MYYFFSFMENFFRLKTLNTNTNALYTNKNVFFERLDRGERERKYIFDILNLHGVLL